MLTLFSKLHFLCWPPTIFKWCSILVRLFQTEKRVHTNDLNRLIFATKSVKPPWLWHTCHFDICNILVIVEHSWGVEYRPFQNCERYKLTCCTRYQQKQNVRVIETTEEHEHFKHNSVCCYTWITIIMIIIKSS